MDIAENVAIVRSRIAEAALAVGRRPQDVLLVAATKMNDAARVRQAICAGVEICGENRVQEMLEKNAQAAYAGARLHFIGHLQKNKVKQVVGTAALIESVDSVELMRLIDRTAESKDIKQEILLEINIGGETAKSGFEPESVPQALEAAARFSHIMVRGLMAIPPKCSRAEENIPYFRRMQKLFIDNSEKKYDNVVMDFLSMGMSADYTAAIACGSNMVRVGTAIFGARNYGPINSAASGGNEYEFIQGHCKYNETESR